jgi:hypothetical protein
MSDESGGDFGGGSVKWQITYPKDSNREHDATVNAQKKKSQGVDERSGLTKFYLVLKNTPGLKDKLLAAANFLGTGTPNAVVIELPIEQGRQIRVLWDQPHDPLI